MAGLIGGGRRRIWRRPVNTPTGYSFRREVFGPETSRTWAYGFPCVPASRLLLHLTVRQMICDFCRQPITGDPPSQLMLCRDGDRRLLRFDHMRCMIGFVIAHSDITKPRKDAMLTLLRTDVLEGHRGA